MSTETTASFHQDAPIPSGSPDTTLTMSGWREQGAALKKTDSDLRWALADWLVLGENKFGSLDALSPNPVNVYSVASELFPDHPRKYFRELAYVARNVPASVRQDALSFSHHQVVAALDRAAQVRWLKEAVEKTLSVSKLREAIKYEYEPRLFPIPLSYALSEKLNTLARAVGQSAESLARGAVELLVASETDKIQAELDAARQYNDAADARRRIEDAARARAADEWTRTVKEQREAYARTHPAPQFDPKPFEVELTAIESTLEALDKQLKEVENEDLRTVLAKERAHHEVERELVRRRHYEAVDANREELKNWQSEVRNKFPNYPPDERLYRAQLAARIAKEFADAAEQLAQKAEVASAAV